MAFPLCSAGVGRKRVENPCWRVQKGPPTSENKNFIIYLRRGSKIRPSSISRKKSDRKATFPTQLSGRQPSPATEPKPKPKVVDAPARARAHELRHGGAPAWSLRGGGPCEVQRWAWHVHHHHRRRRRGAAAGHRPKKKPERQVAATPPARRQGYSTVGNRVFGVPGSAEHLPRAARGVPRRGLLRLPRR